MQTTAIILAGGKSKRMGTDKALLKVGGTALLEKSVALCKTVCNHIIISSNNTEHDKYGYPLVADEIENCGPMGGIYSSLKKSETEWNFIISVDSAYVEPEFVSFLFSQAGDFDAIVPFSSNGREPLIALYNKQSLPVIEENLNTGNFRVNNLLNAINTKWIDAESWIEKYPKLFYNLNRPEDL
ncbi:molybdenum cofactor guanylyltransferase [Prolixibacteraceae bacterium Z1-6]|uniref:Probable molybdenum cofactor guanylyltransferase n=1 Tax=Draconibacterium aestuarii TaxID=2998507 RepID=A0A9X3F4E1_9BACT|nr:molybdenum cofactor guanylyltransferase [Prolixibacteraceae bacterium Z1-6]